jgi:hypothetical protein
MLIARGSKAGVLTAASAVVGVGAGCPSKNARMHASERKAAKKSGWEAMGVVSQARTLALVMLLLGTTATIILHVESIISKRTQMLLHVTILNIFQSHVNA